jgi:hypothetical protein
MERAEQPAGQHTIAACSSNGSGYVSYAAFLFQTLLFALYMGFAELANRRIESTWMLIGQRAFIGWSLVPCSPKSQLFVRQASRQRIILHDLKQGDGLSRYRNGHFTNYTTDTE